MTVPASQANRYTYAGNGVTTAFAYSSKFLANADLVVVLVNNTTGVETVKTLTTHYTITGAGTSAGTVTMLTAPATGETLVIYGDPVISQLVDPVNGNDLDVDVVIEAPLDRLTIIARRLKDIVTRSLRQPEGDTTEIARLPAAADRASRYMAFDANGDPIASSGTDGLGAVPVSVFMKTVLDDANAAAARSTLGAAASANPAFTGTSLTLGAGMSIVAECATDDAFEMTIAFADATADRTITFPDATTTVVGTDTAQTLSNKTLVAPALGTPLSGVLTNCTDTIVAASPQASTSGTVIDFSAIPSGVKKIDVSFVGVSTNGTSNIIVQLGDSGGIETTGYLSVIAGVVGASAGAVTNGFGVAAPTAASVIHGVISFCLVDASTRTWAMSSNLSFDSGQVNVSAGSKSLSAELTSLRITMANGTDTFDAGKMNILYQR